MPLVVSREGSRPKLRNMQFTDPWWTVVCLVIDSAVRLWFLISMRFRAGILSLFVRPSKADPLELSGFTTVMNLFG